MLATLAFTLAFHQDRTLTNGLCIGGVSLSGRRPYPVDAILAEIVAGKWSSPKAGESVAYRGENRTWKSVKANADGWFENPALDNGYLDLRFEEPTARIANLQIQGNTGVYVNGELRPGDPYGTGYLTLPVKLKAGENELLCVAGRGRIKATIVPVYRPVQLQKEDATMPDVVPGEKETLWAGITVRNASETPAKDLKIRAKLGNSELVTSATNVAALTIRKEKFRIPRPRELASATQTLSIQLLDSKNNVLDDVKIELAVKGPLDKQRITFLSKIDGSVQYYSAAPAQKPSAENALVETLHGASVEATSQIGAYKVKDWCSIIAPTNRRPYGFDWEDIGRSDALEVLDLAKKRFLHDPTRVNLTGHSMGGHGTWSVGTLYPNLFASINPSAGWISFWSYAGGWSPDQSLQTENLLRRSMNVGDTLGRAENMLTESVYILHGDADDNVPVTEARTMRKKLEELKHPHLQYHEQPGAGHWWGDQCVDWPPLFDNISSARLNPDPDHIDFTTQNPGVSSELGWVQIEQQIHPLAPSHVVADRIGSLSIVRVKTDNVALLRLAKLPKGYSLEVDGKTVTMGSRSDVFLDYRLGAWAPVRSVKATDKSSGRTGPFKMVYNNQFVFVVGSGGTDADRAWAANKARLDAETMAYRGNATPEVILDNEFLKGAYRGRNVVLYGNHDTNLAWGPLLVSCPIDVRHGIAWVGNKTYKGDQFSALLVFPNPDDSKALVAAVCATGDLGNRYLERLPLFTSGIAYPDWTLFDASETHPVVADGFFSNNWNLSPDDQAFAK